MIDVDLLLRLIKAMNHEGVNYITFGAVALMAHGLVRNTEDADFFVAPDAENIDRLKRALHTVWDDTNIDDIRAEDLLGDYPSVRYGPPGDDFTIDFLTRLGEAYRYDTLEWETKEIEGVSIRVVTPMQLYRMKRDTIRYKDKLDAAALREEFSLPED